MMPMIERMPWRGKFTPEEGAIIEARSKRVADTMIDAWGLFGQMMNIPDGVVTLLAVQVAMAGDFFDDGHGKFIEYRLVDQQTPPEGDVSVVFKDLREWRKVGEFNDDENGDV